jgi:hypothetical protein
MVDWETAGWYPPYWKYTTASQANPQNMIFWKVLSFDFEFHPKDVWSKRLLCLLAK